MASIRTAGPTKDFGDLRAVNEIDLDLPEGWVAGFVGPNGAGKSTTIRMLLGLGLVEIRSLLMHLGASGMTVFVSSHLLAEIQAACDSIVMIDHGGVVFSGPMADLLAQNSSNHPGRGTACDRHGPPRRTRRCCRLPSGTSQRCHRDRRAGPLHR